MKQEQSIDNGHSMMFSHKEIEVLEILVQFPTLILELESRCRFPFTWGRKRTRSAIGVTPSPSPLHHHPPPSSENQSPPPLVKAEASSPATPLSFSPSESEEKPTLFRRNVSLKRKREYYVKIVEELTEGNGLLKGEIRNVKCYFDKLKNFNLKLKARKQELSLGPNQDDDGRHQWQLQLPGTAHRQPLFVNKTVGPPQMSEGKGVARLRIQQEQQGCGQATTSLEGPSSSCSAFSVGNSNNDMGPMGIPDLNMPLEESMVLEVDCCDVSRANKDVNRAMAAEARQKRIQICRVKNPIGKSKIHYSCR